MDEVFKELPDVVGIADDFRIVGYDDNGTDMTEHYAEYYRYVQRILMLNKDKYHFRCTSVPFGGKLFLNMG